MGKVMRSIDYVRDRYGSVVARLVRMSIIGLLLVGVCGLGVVGLAKITPTGFLPEDDQGAFFVVAQTPGGASVSRTTDVIERAEAILRQEKAVADVTAVIGLNFIDNYSQPNAGFLVVTLKPFEERKKSSLGVREVITNSIRSSARSRAAQSSRWRRRPFSASGPAVDLLMCCRIFAAVTQRIWRRRCAG